MEGNEGWHEVNDKFEKDPVRDKDEYVHLKNVCSAFANYLVDSKRDIGRMERDYLSLSDYYKDKLIFDYNKKINRLNSTARQNYAFLLKIIFEYSYMFKFYKKDNEILIEPLNVSAKDIIKLRSTLKLFVREWAEEGKPERENCHMRIVNELIAHFPHPNGQKVLVPGAGLGRLVFELCKAGFSSQGNEFSYFMLLSSNFILNKTSVAKEFRIYPNIHTFSNVYSEEGPYKEYKIPDVCLAEELSGTKGDMSMIAGEFVEVYSNKIESFNAVATSFFLDTANNVISYIDTIHKILKVNGVWVNFGPLLYHYSEMPNEVSIELSWEEIKQIMTNKFKFKITKEEFVDAEYSSAGSSMLRSVYNCIFFTAVKYQ